MDGLDENYTLLIIAIYKQAVKDIRRYRSMRHLSSRMEYELFKAEDFIRRNEYYLDIDPEYLLSQAETPNTRRRVKLTKW